METWCGSRSGQLMSEMHELIEAAVQDNAAWCRFVSFELNHVPVIDVHGGVLFRGNVPAFYPNFVSTSAGAAKRSEGALVNTLGELHLPPGFGIKDSYANLDLSHFGYHRVIEAQWIALEMRKRVFDSTHQDFTTPWVTSPVELEAWLTAARLSCFDTNQFFSSAVDSSRVSFLSVKNDGYVIAGAVFTKFSEAIGVSNVFSTSPDVPIWSLIIQAGQERFGSATLVDWESGDALDEARRAGVICLQPLRVWVNSSASP